MGQFSCIPTVSHKWIAAGQVNTSHLLIHSVQRKKITDMHSKDRDCIHLFFHHCGLLEVRHFDSRNIVNPRCSSFTVLSISHGTNQNRDQKEISKTFIKLTVL